MNNSTLIMYPKYDDKMKIMLQNVNNFLIQKKIEYQKDPLHELKINLEKGIFDFNTIKIECRDYFVVDGISIKITIPNYEHTIYLEYKNENKSVFVEILSSLKTIRETYIQRYVDTFTYLIGKESANQKLANFTLWCKCKDINFPIDDINNIDWKALMDTNVVVDDEFIEIFGNNIDWTIISRYGNIDLSQINFDNMDKLYTYEYLFLNQKVSAKDKTEYINHYGGYDEQYFVFDDCIDNLIQDRISNKISDNILDTYLENNLPINMNMISQYYPLSAELVTKYIDKFSIDCILKNKTIKDKYDIIVLFKDKIK